ncbi:DUF58 domain-containing protein [Saccharothrix yanglingensis]|uniref:DUF58 domain-containing protein n=1 Tax=Saccharothrix yanglingensis TaxID=659496 RepID=A0ABU0X573_9PSEU|nr:DUF58 domain-containing protein [Saccharothrix yanglingensis]MDQ2587291.1 DUF58 domain-containing protein [Saccharothrix yanglingensis]
MRLREATAAVGRVSRAVTPFGRLVLVTSVAGWWLGGELGWSELVLVGATGVVVFALACLLTLGRATLRVRVGLDRRRVVVGGVARCRVDVEPTAAGRVLPSALELPVGDRVESFDVPGGNREHTEHFDIPTDRRGVVVVGPATTVRGDPLGLLRRTVTWTDPVELFAHPVTVPLESMASGLLRDVEGRTTADLSMSDLAFHALREYVPGDDQRHIHWRSSAKLATPGTFLVRQYLDTRRAHLAVVVDGDAAAYPDAEHFETAVSVGASIAVRAIADEVETSVLAAGQVAHRAAARPALDAFTRAVTGPTPLIASVTRVVQVVPDMTTAIVVTGTGLSFAELRATTAAFAPEVRKVVVRVDHSARTALSGDVLTLGRLADLPALLVGGGLG